MDHTISYHIISVCPPTAVLATKPQTEPWRLRGSSPNSEALNPSKPEPGAEWQGLFVAALIVFVIVVVVAAAVVVDFAVAVAVAVDVVDVAVADVVVVVVVVGCWCCC